MLHLPKFARDRLKASVSPVGHPDPDMLTAWSERSLPAQERAVVMEHLARCGDCRDVVAFALAATDTVLEPAPAPHRDWFRWPVLRWAAVAAGILVIAAIGIEQYRGRQEPVANFMARNQTAQNQAPQAEMHVSSRATQPTPPSREEVGVAADHAPAASEPANPTGAALAPPDDLSKSASAGSAMGRPVAGGGGIAHGWHGSSTGRGTGRPMNEPAKNLFAPSPSSAPTRTKPPSLADSEQKPVVPSTSQMVEVQSAAPAITAQDQSQGQRQDQQLDLYAAKTQPSNAQQLYAENDKTLSKAKQPTQQVEVSAAAPIPASPAQPVMTARNVVSLSSVTWSVTTTGGLQRSFDNGKTWQDVNVTASPEAESNFMKTAESVTVYATAGPAEKKGKKEDAKSTKQSKATPILRAVAANGLDVWAGGSAGALYHSVDAGDHWARIFPLAGSVLLTADITGIQFSDPQHGTITTATSQTWTTTDAGRSWQKR